MRQKKVEHKCPKCGGPLKTVIGAQSRKKFWECVDNGVGCYRVRKDTDRPKLSMDISDRWYPR